MKEDWWVNYETGRYIALKCRGLDHEAAIWIPENRKHLGIPQSVVQEIHRFQPRINRDALLLHLMNTLPLMRIRGHDSFVTIEFSSNEDCPPLDAIRKWARKNAGPGTVLNIVNFSSGHIRAISVLPHQLEEMGVVQPVCTDDWHRGSSTRQKGRRQWRRKANRMEVAGI